MVDDADRKRSSKACERCRRRRSRCVGGFPCEACVRVGLRAECQVREKARPGRPPPLERRRRRVRKAAGAGAETPSCSAEPDDSLLGEDRTPTLSSPAPVTLDEEPRGPTPLCPPPGGLGIALQQWCADSGIPYASLLFADETRLDRLAGEPLPSDPGALATFEDALMSTFVSAPDFDNLNYLDRDRLLRLYERYRRLPNSVNEDQLAFLYAVFCLSRFNQLRTADATHTPSSHLSHPEHIPREDLTYFHRACQAMTRWGRPSVWSLWGLSCLVPYSIATAGPAETDFLLDRMVMHVRELGIHQRGTAGLYPAEDMVGLLFSAFFYMDTLAAYELDFDSAPLSAIAPGCLASASLHQAHFLNHVAAHPEDLASKEYIASTISTWNETLYALRRDKLSTIPRVKRAWAEVRYSWMQVLLLTPSISSPDAGSTTLPLLARVASQILSTFAELAALGHMSPAWPQVRQIVACGQLVVVCTASGELHQLEARRLMETLLDLLVRFAHVWPSTTELVVSFRKAADSLGLGVTPEDIETPLAAPLPQAGSTFEEINHWLLDYPFEFDFSSVMLTDPMPLEQAGSDAS
ncbi:hypothetical protein Q8F55_004467 [Vanrija albida]|uniref:Zn(2)-C6 fungal-type domain-containing protein n=1 Tax=Vanrija albida TaxID=181172 RepID=A0ABR3Q6U3_9TREE